MFKQQTTAPQLLPSSHLLLMSKRARVWSSTASLLETPLLESPGREPADTCRPTTRSPHKHQRAVIYTDVHKLSALLHSECLGGHFIQQFQNNTCQSEKNVQLITFLCASLVTPLRTFSLVLFLYKFSIKWTFYLKRTNDGSYLRHVSSDALQSDDSSDKIKTDVYFKNHWYGADYKRDEPPGFSSRCLLLLMHVSCTSVRGRVMFSSILRFWNICSIFFCLFKEKSCSYW